MAQLKKKKGPENKSSTHERIQLAAIGMEAEFAVIMDGVQVKPEDAFGSPRKIIREKMMHRKGRAYLLAHILPVPVMLLAANRQSTGIGVRPRGDRIEITADFTPDAPLMIATATLIVGIVREVMRWPSYEIATLENTDIPVIRGFR